MDHIDGHRLEEERALKDRVQKDQAQKDREAPASQANEEPKHRGLPPFFVHPFTCEAGASRSIPWSTLSSVQLRTSGALLPGVMCGGFR